MPKQRITKEMVIDAAFALTREKGLARAGVTEIAARAGCSDDGEAAPQPPLGWRLRWRAGFPTRASI